MAFTFVNVLKKRNLTNFNFTIEMVKGLLGQPDEGSPVLTTPATRAAKRKIGEVDITEDQTFVMHKKGTRVGNKRKRGNCAYHSNVYPMNKDCFNMVRTFKFGIFAMLEGFVEHEVEPQVAGRVREAPKPGRGN